MHQSSNPTPRQQWVGKANGSPGRIIYRLAVKNDSSALVMLLRHEQLGKPFPDFFGATLQA
jgi:hypothetical protein